MKTAKIFNRIVSICMIAIMLIAAAPVSFAAGIRYSMTVTEVMRYFDNAVKKPKQSCILEEPVEMTVTSEHGNLIYVMSEPRGGKKLNKAEEGATIVVYAKQGGYALGLVKGTSIGGWMNELLLTADYRNYTEIAVEGESLSLSEIMDKFDNAIQKPKNNAVLDESEAMVVNSKHGNFIYVLTAPKTGKKILKALEGATVVVYARQNGYALAMVEGTSIGGWMNESLLAYN